MAFISGFLGIGTGLSDGALVEPASGAGYARQPVFFNAAPSGIALNTLNCVFGPVTSSWGTLVAFMVFDGSNNPVYPGTLNQPLTPTIGELLNVPVGGVALSLTPPLASSVILSGYQAAIPAASGYPAGSVLTPPTVAGGIPGVSSVGITTMATKLAATGTTSGSAIALVDTVNHFSTVVASGAAILQASSLPVTVVNRGSNELIVYPQAGAQIDGNGVGNPVGINAGTAATFLPADATDWTTY